MYNKSAKLEYSRYIVFENIEEKSEEIKRCLEKIEKDVEKNVIALQNLDKEFMEALEDYKIKKANMIKCKEENVEAKKEYEKILERTNNIVKAILEEDINFAKEFVELDNKDKKRDLNNILTENGINERNQFDPDVISNSVNISFEIYKKEIEIFLNGYDKTKKLLEEIEENDVKIDKHKKYINDSKAKLDFLSAEKDYIIGFLDNERIAAIYDKKLHRKLMLEACRNFESDLVHINNLYDIILKEAISRASKRLYKDNYNKAYLTDIEKTLENVNEEVNKLKANSLAVMNLNYWRIEGISRIQEIFEKDVKEIYGRDLDEIFPREEIENNQEATNKKETILEYSNTEENSTLENNIIEEDKSIIEENKVQDDFIKNPNYKLLKSKKGTLEDDLNKLENKNEEIDENSDLGGLFEKISMLDDLDEENFSRKAVLELENKIANDEVQENVDKIENNSNDIDENIQEDEEEEESIFDFYFKQPDLSERKRKIRDEKKLNGDKKNLFKKIIGFNSKKQKEA